MDGARDILRAGDSSTSCERARRQLLAVALNRAAGGLSNACCIEWEGKQVSLGSALNRRDIDCHERRDCDSVRDIMAAFNDASRVSHCGSAGDDDDEHDDDHDDHDDGHRHQQGNGHEKAHGKGHSCD